MYMYEISESRWACMCLKEWEWLWVLNIVYILHIYIYKERASERESERERESCGCIIYINVWRASERAKERERERARAREGERARERERLVGAYASGAPECSVCVCVRVFEAWNGPDQGLGFRVEDLVNLRTLVAVDEDRRPRLHRRCESRAERECSRSWLITTT
jgi:hypothetical protein